MPITSFGYTDVGCVRKMNQDRILLDESLGLYAVADGMGGHSHGETAAELALDTLRYYMDCSRDRFDVTWPFGYNFDLSIDANRLVTAIQLANRQVWRYAEQAPEYSGMGTTLASLLFTGSRTIVGHVGDSRIYLIRGEHMHQLTADDTWISAVLARGLLQPHEAAKHPMKNVLTQAAGSRDPLNVHILEQALEPNDTFILSSDGLHGVIGDEAIASVLSAGADLEQTVYALINSARQHGGPDNISCVMVRYNP
jgi:PPM family protein phosphatase